MTRKEPSMSIDINPETEHLVREEIRSGHFSSVDDLIGRILSTLSSRSGRIPLRSSFS